MGYKKNSIHASAKLRRLEIASYGNITIIKVVANEYMIENRSQQKLRHIKNNWEGPKQVKYQ